MSLKGHIKQLAEPFHSLRNGSFAKLYLAQTVSLFGDAVTWVGIALLAYQFGEARSVIILSVPLSAAEAIEPTIRRSFLTDPH